MTPAFQLIKIASALCVLRFASSDATFLRGYGALASALAFAWTDMAYSMSSVWYWMIALISSRVSLSAADCIEIRCRVWPSDIDWLGHMNNAKYARKLEWARLIYVIRSGVGRAMRKLGVSWGFGGVSIRFRRELRLFAAFYVTSTYAGCDNATRSFYIEHRMETRDADGNVFVHAHAVSRMVFKRGQKVQPSDLASHLGWCDPSNKEELPPIIKSLAAFDSASSAMLRKEGTSHPSPRL